MAAKKSVKKAGASKAGKVSKKAAGKKRAKKASAKKSGAKKKAAGKRKAKKAAPKKASTGAPAAAKPADDAPAAAEGEEAPARPPRPIPKMPARRSDGVITVAYSPDADDAFMFYALLNDKVDTQGRRYELVQDEIQVLNQKAEKGVYDVTAISFGAYPYLADRYLLLTCGASFGDGRGPILVAKSPIRTSEVNGLTVAVPGLKTTATLALRLWLPQAGLDLKAVPFDQVLTEVREERARAGLLIHEAQLTWREDNLLRVVDFGQWWSERTEGLPLPLGANAIRRDIPEEERKAIGLDIKRSIAYGLGHREETLDYAVPFAKGLAREVVDTYVGMYVNELALDYAERGRQAVRHLFAEALRWGLIPDTGEPEFA